MRRRKPDCLVILCAVLAVVSAILSGCGGAMYNSNAVAAGGIGDTPPPADSRDSWKTGFENSEGYTLGNIDGQNGWHIDLNPRPYASELTVSNDRAANGSNCLKMEYPSSFAGTWEENIVTLVAPSVVPDVPMNSVIVRMKIWRDPELTEYPVGTGSMRSSIEINQFSCYPSPIRYMDLGETENDLKMHALLRNTNPRTSDDAGWQIVTGRFVELVCYDNFKTGTRVVWYDNKQVAVVPISNPQLLFRRFVIGYGSGYPHAAARIGKPIYIDDVVVNWEPATAIRIIGN